MIWGPELLLNLIYLTCEHAAWVYRVWLCINPHLIAGCHGVGPFVVVSHLDWMFLLINVFVALKRLSHMHELNVAIWHIELRKVIVIPDFIFIFQRVVFDFEHIESYGSVSRVLVVDVEVISFIGVVLCWHVHNLELYLQDFKSFDWVFESFIFYNNIPK